MKQMKYEVVELAEKKMVGLTARTKNSDENMTMIIGSLWKDFYGQVYAAVENKVNSKTICTYSDYESDCNSEYSASVGCEVSNTQDIPKGAVIRTIPAGKYAKFIVRGNMQQACLEFWQELWQMTDLPRSYQCDFEEYQNSDMENAEIHMYISLK